MRAGAWWGHPYNTAYLCSLAAGTHQRMGSPPPASSGTSTSRTSISDHYQTAETRNSPRGMKQYMGSSPDTCAPTARRGQDPDTEGDTEAEATITDNRPPLTAEEKHSGTGSAHCSPTGRIWPKPDSAGKCAQIQINGKAGQHDAGAIAWSPWA